jgi:hypothetical protein
MLTKEDIFESFRKLETSAEKVEYIRWLQRKDLNLRINYENLIEYWSTH